MRLLTLSDLYALPGLKKKIMGELKTLLNTNNVVSVFCDAMQTENKNLIQKSSKFMADNLQAVSRHFD